MKATFGDNFGYFIVIFLSSYVLYVKININSNYSRQIDVAEAKYNIFLGTISA